MVVELELKFTSLARDAALRTLLQVHLSGPITALVVQLAGVDFEDVLTAPEKALRLDDWRYLALLARDVYLEKLAWFEQTQSADETKYASLDAEGLLKCRTASQRHKVSAF